MDKTTQTPSPDETHKEREEQTLAAAARINPRATRHCWTPQEARVFNEWDT